MISDKYEDIYQFVYNSVLMWNSSTVVGLRGLHGARLCYMYSSTVLTVNKWLLTNYADSTKC